MLDFTSFYFVGLSAASHAKISSVFSLANQEGL
jgi:hypothetical protein